MERWCGRVALVTGASTGIGAAIAKDLALNGMTVIGLARRDDKIKELAQELKSAPGSLHAVKADVRKEEEILAAFKFIKDKFKGVDVLVNNAGVFKESPLTETETEEWRTVLDINVLALSICTREAVKSMRERGVDDGHVIHISSLAGHIQPMGSRGAFYFASKHAVRALTEGLRKDFVEHKEKIKVTSISPGLVKTDIFDDLKVFSKEVVFQSGIHLLPDDISNAVLYALGTPPHVQIHEMIIRPVGQEI